MAFAHHSITVDVHGPADCTISIPSHYCPGDETGVNNVKKAVRAEARARGLRLGTWDYVRFDPGSGWEARVWGAKRCVAFDGAPTNGAECDATATTTRTVEGIDCGLCGKHAAELDQEN